MLHLYLIMKPSLLSGFQSLDVVGHRERIINLKTYAGNDKAHNHCAYE